MVSPRFLREFVCFNKHIVDGVIRTHADGGGGGGVNEEDIRYLALLFFLLLVLISLICNFSY